MQHPQTPQTQVGKMLEVKTAHQAFQSVDKSKWA